MNQVSKTLSQRRRTAMGQAGCSTYEISMFDGNFSILCLCCGKRSFNTNDIEHRFCGYCGEWHSEWSEESGGEL
jgi:hypothetical protein